MEIIDKLHSNEPWKWEPNELTFTDEVTGYECFIWRNPNSGNLCGYVKVPEYHLLYKIEYADPCPDKLKDYLATVMQGGCGKRTSLQLFCYNPENPF